MDPAGEPIAIFEEVQNPPWPLMALGVGAGAAGGFAAGRAISMAAGLGAAGAIASGLGLVFSEFLFPMRTTVSSDQVQIRFGRRTRFRIPLSRITQAYARTYDPLREYGGWGIRGGSRGGAFNMRGREGVQLVLRSGKRLLIGSQRAGELAEIIQRLSGCAAEAAPDPSPEERAEETAGTREPEGPDVEEWSEEV